MHHATRRPRNVSSKVSFSRLSELVAGCLGSPSRNTSGCSCPGTSPSLEEEEKNASPLSPLPCAYPARSATLSSCGKLTASRTPPSANFRSDLSRTCTEYLLAARRFCVALSEGNKTPCALQMCRIAARERESQCERARERGSEGDGARLAN